MQYCAWPNYVNRVIIDSTNVTVGDGAVIADAIEGSPKSRRRLTVANPPDKYSVTMHFDCYERMTHYPDGREVLPTDPNYNTTEKDRFFKWFKGVHKFGTVPVEFPSILWNSNYDSKGYITEEDAQTGNLPYNEHYIITSPVEGSKHGNSIAVTMSWETFSTGVYEIPVPEKSVIDDCRIESGYAVFNLSAIAEANPVSNWFEVKIDGNVVPHSVYSDETPSSIFYITFSKVGTGHTVSIRIVGDSIIGNPDGYTRTF